MLETNAIGGKKDSGPIKLALAFGHLEAARRMLKEGLEWAIILEDDACPSEWVFAEGQIPQSYLVPEDTDVLFLHHRFRGDRTDPLTGMRITNRGIGTEAFLISSQMAKKLSSIYCPLLCDCDIQWSAFFHGLSNPRLRNEILGQFVANGGILPSQWIRAYNHPSPPFRELGMTIAPSVKGAIGG